MTQTTDDWVNRITAEGGERAEGRDARTVNFSAGKALSEAIRTTLGPRGMNKMLVSSSGKIVVTNDGASILDRMDIAHPTARMIVDVGKNQEERSGDGTTTAVLLTGELLREAEGLLDQGVHPTSVVRGYELAAARAVDELNARAIEVDPDDRTRLVDIGTTAVTGRWDDRSARRFAELTVEVVRAVAPASVDVHDTVTLQTVVGGSLTDSELVDGLIIDMERSSTSLDMVDTELPRRIENARISLVDDQMTIDRGNAVSHVRVEDPGGHPAMIEMEDEIRAAQASQIAQTDADVVFCQKSIDDELYHHFAREGILAIERTRQDEMHKLARATGGRLVMSSDELEATDVGRAGLVERRRIAGNELIVVSGSPDTEQYSLLLRGGTTHVVDETKRVMEDCLEVVTMAVREGAVVPGGGATEVGLAHTIRDFSIGLDGKEQLAAEAFADALEAVPLTLARNLGIDPIDALIELRARHAEGDWTIGLDGDSGSVSDMVAHGVVEPLAVKRRAIESAGEVACVIVRIDDIIAAAPSEEVEEEEDHDHEETPHGMHGGGGGYPWMVGHAP